jgi:hypothetical protein
MSRTWKWVVASLMSTATLGLSTTLLPGQAVADDSRLVIKPAIVQSNGQNQSSVDVQQVHRRVWVRPRAGVVVGPRRGVGVYVAPRYVPRVYARPVYPRQNFGYQTYPGYGYTYPNYGYGYGYGYTPYYGW